MEAKQRLIDANKLLEKAEWYIDYNPHIGVHEFYHVYVADIEDAPTVDAVEVVHAQWVLADDDKLVCNHCKRVKVAYEQLCFFRSTGCWNYCPNCGAKMDR